MTKLKRYKLDQNKVKEYLHWNLEGLNLLSSTLLALEFYDKGDFFSLLPELIEENKINEFKHGGTGVNLNSYVKYMMWMRLFEDNSLCCIFDEVNFNYQERKNDLLFNLCGLHYEEEIYYLLNKNNLKIENINDCFYASNAIWHSLCILTRTNFSMLVNQKLTKENIRECCKNAELILVGAYDAEGYIFWEKST